MVFVWGVDDIIGLLVIGFILFMTAGAFVMNKINKFMNRKKG